MTQAPLLIVPGRGNSGAGHWQSLFESRFADAQRVEQDNWETPELEDWSRRIDAHVRAAACPPLVVAHSFGCLATVNALLAYGAPMGACLLVAPADPRRFGLAEQRFHQRLPAPAFLVASDNDPWMPGRRAQAFADVWGIDHLILRNAGHLNVDSGHGEWPLGELLVRRMLRQLAQASIFQTVPARPSGELGRQAQA